MLQKDKPEATLDGTEEILVDDDEEIPELIDTQVTMYGFIPTVALARYF